ncbi:hypothetical protein B0A52_06174 [Exophiala mesophila]|uniref:Zn(2)-C6 fungal-type domain-containing protein n=1 Tax=Exophiala mesophila TaxID=212818 RepID=A0A438N2U3_EXOME|nr:hypothetical protein B0A52_06174 [Exophiala mesophila]
MSGKPSNDTSSVPTPSDSTSSKTSTQPPIPSIETPDPTVQQEQASSSIRLPPRTGAQNPVFRIPQSPRSAPGPEASSHEKKGKIAIPRLKRPVDQSGDDAARPGGKHRVTHACEPCRHRKTKCSGERPACRHCVDFKIACYYADGKRDRVKKQFGTMTEKVAEYEKLLNTLMPRVSDADASLIRLALERDALDDEAPSTVDALTESESTALHTLDSGGESGAESEASAGAGSTGALDRTDEDFTREKVRNTGYMGKNSEVTWLQRLREQNQSGHVPHTARDGPSSKTAFPRASGDDNSPEDVDTFTTADSNYHLDDLAISTFEHVDPYEMPPPETAQHLFNSYITRVHPTFPVVGKTNLTNQFQRFFSGAIATRPPEKWLAIINLIFAIAAQYSHLIKAEWEADERDHLIYFTRARLLSINSETMFQHPDLQHIQILALMSFYLMCISQINRAWIINGSAIRAACAIGMNIRNDSPELKDSLKEIRYRVWWAIYTLEHRLCGMTGRVNCILDDHCTTPLPVPVEEELFETEEAKALLSKERQQGDRAPGSNSNTPSVSASTPSTESRSRSQTKVDSRSPSATNRVGDLDWAKDVPPNPALYFLHLVQLARLTQNIFHRLYNPNSVRGTWSQTQEKIKELDVQLESWYQKLPPAYAFRRKQRDRTAYEYRLGLGFFFYGTKMTVHRPCLCRLDRKIPNQSQKSLEFNRNSALACVEAAIETLNMIPDEPNAIGLMRIGPWWDILQRLVQASSVLMLELSFRVNHMPEAADIVLESGKKVVRWLHALGDENVSAARAWKLCAPLFQVAARKIGRDVSDLPQNPPGKMAEQDADTSDVGYPPTTFPQGPALTNAIYQSIPTSQPFSLYDPMMQYDQYIPGDFAMDQNMMFQAAPDTGFQQYQTDTSADMDLLHTGYHDEQAQQPQGHANPAKSRPF